MSRWYLVNVAILLGIIASMQQLLKSEIIYDQPYLGDRVAEPPARPIYNLVQEAELIFIGESGPVKEKRHPSGNGVKSYTGSVQIVEVLKGNSSQKQLNLIWFPSATGFGAGSNHLFFVKYDLGKPVVLKEMYMHRGSYDAMRAYGYLEGGKEATLKVVKALVDAKSSRTGLTKLLHEEAKHSRYQRRSTATLLSIDLAAKESIPALRETVLRRGEHYQSAAYYLGKLDREEGVKSILASLVSTPKPSRLMGMWVFSALAAIGGQRTVTFLADFGTKYPEFQVSCAFTMARVGGAMAEESIEKWIENKANAAKKERVFDGYLLQEPTRGKLLGSALAEAKELETPSKDSALSGDIEAVVVSNSEFAFDLYAKLKDDPKVKEAGGNLFFSPFSISTALAMTNTGAGGRTAKQMAQVLHFPSDWGPSRIAAVFAASGKAMRVNPDKLLLANALFGQKGYKFLRSFVELIREYFGAGLDEVDFINAAERERTRKKINSWVKKHTEEKIKELIGPGVLDYLTRLVLVNAIYFKDKWEIQFDKKDTRDAPFVISADKEVDVPMMYVKEEFKYWANANLQILELPYNRERLSMIVLLPREIDGLSALENSLTLENLNDWQSKLHKQEVMVYLPRFKMTWGVFELEDVLGAMGMKDAFSLPPADFSGMTGREDLFISHVLHKAFVEVNEEGTEAAAATAVVGARRKAGPVWLVFRADHPFVFMIKENRTGSILFMGRVIDPAKLTH